MGLQKKSVCVIKVDFKANEKKTQTYQTVSSNKDKQ